MDFKIINIDTINSDKRNLQKRINKQFGSLAKLQSDFENDEQILKMIFKARLSKIADRCPGKQGKICNHTISSFRKIPNALAYRCKCGFKVYPLKGTPLEQTRIGLMNIINITYLMFCSKHGLCATEVQRITGWKYETSHKTMMKISDAFGLLSECRSFDEYSDIEIDEVYVKIRTGNGRGRKAVSNNKAPVLVLRERGTFGIVKSFQISAATTAIIKEIILKYTKTTNTIYTDESPIYNFLKDCGYNHFTIKHKDKKYVDAEDNMIHTNTVESFNRLVKTSTHRVHNGVTKDYLQSYINRLAFNTSYREYSAFDAISKLIELFPPLFSNGTKRIKSKPYILPEWTNAA